MPATTYPQGLAFGAASIGGGFTSIPNINGNVFYVDPTNGNDTQFGTTPQTALKTIAKAHTLCTSGQGDTIFVMSGSSAEAVTITKDLVSLIGCQIAGFARPTINPAAGVPLTVTGQGFVARHINFVSTAADAVVQQGNGFEYDDCIFDGDLTAAKAGIRLLPTTADATKTASSGRIHHCYIIGSVIGIAFDTGGTGSSDNWVYANRFSGNTKDITAEKTGADGTFSLATAIIGPDNIFEDKSKAVYIDFVTNIDGAAGNQTGVIAGNYFNSATLTNVLVKINGTGFGAPGNYYQVGIKDTSAF